MPLIDMQVRLRELGRIRTGVTVEGTSKAGRKFRRPEKLATFRLTSPSKSLIEAAAEIYGGKDATVQPWESPAGRQWELITTVDALPIVIPSGESLSQWYEMWAAGGCERRCDGRNEQISDGPCLCPSDPAERRELASRNTPEACKPTTRLNVVLPDLPDLGVWRLESHGYYAAVELAGAAQFLAMASAAGMNIPARLRLEQREKKVPGKPTNRYAVPVIEFTTTRITDLLAAGAGPMMLGESEPSAAPQLAPGSLTPDKAKRARGPKVDRPAMGDAPEVPDGSGFGRPVPTAAAEPPAPPTTPQAPPAAETVGGREVADGAPTAGAAAVQDEEATFSDGPPFLTVETFRGLRERHDVTLEETLAAGRELFPAGTGLKDLDDTDRGRLWVAIQERRATVAST